VITRRADREWAAYEQVGNVPMIRIPPSGDLKGKGWQALGPMLLFMLRVFFVLLRIAPRYDIIMVSGINLLPTPAVLVSAIANKKCLVKIESPVELGEAISAKSLDRMKLSNDSIVIKLVRWFRHIIIKRVDCFVAISAEIRRGLIDMGVGPHKIASIPNGINTDNFCVVSSDQKMALRQRLLLPSDKVILIFTGRLAVSKGALLLIEVWKDLAERYDDTHLVLVGSGKGSFDDCENELKEYIKANSLAQRVTMTGEVENVHEYLNASDIFVFSSDYEGFGLSVLEALACGLVVVATQVGVALELIKNHENGILIEPKDRQQLKVEIEWLLAHRVPWAVMGKNARKAINEKYRIEVVAEEYLETFKNLK
jgi:glycosyltransferase involved in cell wall biosynthesis